MACGAEDTRGYRSDFVRALVNARANVEAETPDGRTPLRLAAGQGSRHSFSALLLARADPLTTDSDGRNILDVCQSREILSMIADLDLGAPMGLS